MPSLKDKQWNICTAVCQFVINQILNSINIYKLYNFNNISFWFLYSCFSLWFLSYQAIRLRFNEPMFYFGAKIWLGRLIYYSIKISKCYAKNNLPGHHHLTLKYKYQAHNTWKQQSYKRFGHSWPREKMRKKNTTKVPQLDNSNTKCQKIFFFSKWQNYIYIYTIFFL